MLVEEPRRPLGDSGVSVCAEVVPRGVVLSEIVRSVAGTFPTARPEQGAPTR